MCIRTAVLDSVEIMSFGTRNVFRGASHQVKQSVRPIQYADRVYDSWPHPSVIRNICATMEDVEKD
jgi:hypothetical protein